MTDRQLAKLAAAAARRTTVTYKTWLKNKRDGKYPDDGALTAWGELFAYLDQIGAGATPPPAPVPSIYATGQRCVFFSQVTDQACREFAACGPGYTALLSADRNEAWTPRPDGAYYATDDEIKLLASGGGRVTSWCDSDQTPISYAVELRGRIAKVLADKLDHVGEICGQFETVEQWHLGRDHALRLMIGNPSELKDKPELAQAISAVNNGEVALIGEALVPDPLYSAQGINISSVCFYVDGDAANGGYRPVSAFAGQPAGQRRVCSIYTGGKMTGEDWRLFREWTRP